MARSSSNLLTLLSADMGDLAVCEIRRSRIRKSVFHSRSLSVRTATHCVVLPYLLRSVGGYLSPVPIPCPRLATTHSQTGQRNSDGAVRCLWHPLGGRAVQ